MDLHELEEVLKEEVRILEERNSKLEEAVWFIQRLESEDYNTPEGRINIENDLKTIIEELNIEYAV